MIGIYFLLEIYFSIGLLLIILATKNIFNKPKLDIKDLLLIFIGGGLMYGLYILPFIVELS